MRTRSTGRRRAGRLGALTAAVAVALAVLAPTGQAAPAGPAGGSGDRGHDRGFVTRAGSQLVLDGRPFRFAGANNYYPMYKSRLMVDDVFADAAGAGLTVMRVWGSLEIGNQDGSDSVHGKADGVYFQYWDGTRPVVNDGADGLQRLDYVVASARQHGIKLVIPLVNNWRDFGGMDQYVRWRGADHHDDFYTDPVIRGWYKDWISHLLQRVNPLTGLRYADDPTIMTWELGNEPRCKGSGVYPQSPDCTTATLVNWADEMTRHIKSIDRRHLVSVGDEGFYCVPGAEHWTENCGEGVDTLAFTRLPAVDVMSFHLYPEPWGTDAAWGTDWIARHIRDARRLGKPVMLGEFGLPDKSVRNPVYQEWTDTFVRERGNGFLYWILSGISDDGSLYPDFDGLTVYCPSPVCSTIGNAAEAIRGRPARFPPVADHDTAVTESATPVTLTPAANDIAYGTGIRTGTLDLDPATAGRQLSRAVAGGAFAVGAGDEVTFSPDAGFAGRAVTPYVVRDRRGRTSNVAEITVTVRPDPAAAVKLFSFETGTEGWAAGGWQTDAGTVTQSTEFATDGAFGVRVDSNLGGWFGLNLPESVDIAGKTLLKLDIRTAGAGTPRNMALQVGETFEWCEGTWGWIDPGTTTTLELGLTTEMACDAARFDDIRAIWLFIGPGGTFHLDNIRAE